LILDYSIPSFAATIGLDSISDYLDKVAIQVPIPERSQPLLWSGRFEVSLNRAAVAAGLDHDWFSPVSNPARWRPGQQLFQIMVGGFPLPPLRIDRYAYNPESGIGSGTLCQILKFYDFSRPAEESSSSPGTYPLNPPIIGGTAESVIRWLLGIAFSPVKASALGIPVSSYISPPSPVPPPQLAINLAPGTVFAGEQDTANPIGDAQRHLGNLWQWLTVGAGEVVQNITAEPGDLPMLNFSALEKEPDIEHLDTPAGVVIVTGQYKVLAPTPKDPCPPSKPPVPETDSRGRKTLEKTDEYQPAGALFPELGTNPSPVLAVRRTTYYLYPGSGYPQGVPPEAIAESIFARPLPGQSEEAPWQTITVSQQPIGVLFPQLGTNFALIIASVEIQREDAKIKLEPIGVLFPELGTNTSLVVSRREILTTTPYLPGGARITDPATGQQKCLEPETPSPTRYPVAEVLLETKVARGVARIRPNGWVPLAEQALTLDIGRIAGPSVAQFVAEKIAYQEEIRRDSIDVKMPIPSSWLSAGCPPLFRGQVGADVWLAEGPIIVMDGQSRRAEFSWKGRRLSTNSIPAAVQVIEIDAVPTVIGRVLLIAPMEPISAAPGPSATVELAEPIYTPLRPNADVLITANTGGGGGGGAS
jgi:hypothetical protein